MKSGTPIGNITRIPTGITIASSIGTNIAILRIIRVLGKALANACQHWHARRN